MKLQTLQQRFLAGILAVMLALLGGAGFSAVSVKAASGTVYTCNIARSYAHPVSGEIEDSGGEAAYATGQGMVEGAVSTTGMMEVSDDGNYYLTIRLSLMDYTTNHSFLVQNAGDAGWSAPSMGVTANGTDNNGTTADICIQVPSENCIVRGSMYVSLMGREVVFYCYPTNYSQGNTSGMSATIVTEASGSSQTNGTESGSDTQGTTGTSAGTNGTTGANPNSSGATESNGSTAGTGETQTGTNNQTGGSLGSTAGTTDNSTGSLLSGERNTSDSSSELKDAQGLSLSTAADDTGNTVSTSQGSQNQLWILVAAITISGLILLAVGSGIVYYYRKNWYRWGGVWHD